MNSTMLASLAGEHVMLDLETMGTSHNAAITAIGAARFNLRGIISKFHCLISLEDSVAAGLEMDPSTVLWWLKQGDEARAQFEQPGCRLNNGLVKFDGWLRAAGGMVPIWGNGSDFDNAILTNAFRKVFDFTDPWDYRRNRCYRSLKSIYPDIELVRMGMKHNAADDAESQALHLIKIFDEMGER